MKKILFISLLVSFFTQLYSIEVQLSHAVFQNKSNSYTEIYFWIPAWNLTPSYKGNFQWQIQTEITIMLKKDSNNITYDKFNLSSNSIKDTNELNFSIVDLKRYALSSGKYTVQLQAKDLNNPADNYNFVFDDIIVEPLGSNISISGITLLDTFYASKEVNSFVKNEMFLQPLVIDFYDTKSTKLNFYTELYNTDTKVSSDEKFLVKTCIKDPEMKELTNFIFYKKMSGAPIVPILQNINIKNLVSGNYYLCIDAIDKNNQLLSSQQLFFQRLNFDIQDTINIATYNGADEFGKGFLDTASLAYLHFSVLSLTPIAPYGDITYIQELGKSSSKEFIIQYITNFWKKRDALNPELAWKKYEEQVMIVDRMYSTSIDRGYNTDRGRVHLKYGAPNNITRNRENVAYDYEVWQYYSLQGGQTNVRFIFYNPTMLSNNMQLLHSTARGETVDPNWKSKIYGVTSGREMIDFDNNNFNRPLGSQLERAVDGLK
jgi:GWxTD domain-containing protein